MVRDRVRRVVVVPVRGGRVATDGTVVRAPIRRTEKTPKQRLLSRCFLCSFGYISLSAANELANLKNLTLLISKHFICDIASTVCGFEPHKEHVLFRVGLFEPFEDLPSAREVVRHHSGMKHICRGALCVLRQTEFLPFGIIL